MCCPACSPVSTHLCTHSHASFNSNQLRVPGVEIWPFPGLTGWAVPSRRPRDLPIPADSLPPLKGLPSARPGSGESFSPPAAAEPSSSEEISTYLRALGGRSSPGSEEDSLRGIRIDSFKVTPPQTQGGEGTRIWSRLSHASHTRVPRPPLLHGGRGKDRADPGSGR